MEDRPEKQISPENVQTDLSKAQDNESADKEDVKDREADKRYPDYPHYPAQDDLLNPANNSGRVDVDMDEVNPEDKIS